VINITTRENKVRVKYKTKNIKTDGSPVFLITINHTSAKIISSRNFRLTATRICKVWLSASFVSPLKKIIRVTNAIIEKTVTKMAISPRQRLGFTNVTNRYPPDSKRIYNKKSSK
jgi:hypothetical protein